MSDSGQLPYEVIAVDPDPGRVIGWRRLGRYRDLSAAARAHVEDALEQLADNGGWLVTSEHLVIGPGPDGPATVVNCVCQIGADRRHEAVPSPLDLEGCRRWLLRAHHLADVERDESQGPTAPFGTVTPVEPVTS